MREREKPVKIAFVGTSHTGKTTLFEFYRQKLGNDSKIAFVKEASRLFFQTNAVDNRFSAETQGKIQEIILKNEKEAHKLRSAIILCDRSVIDAVVYVRAQGDKQGAEQLLRKIQFWLPTYDKFLLFDPADIPYRKDSVRQEDEQTRQRFHKAFLDFFSETGISYELISGNLEERIKKIDEVLDLAT